MKAEFLKLAGVKSEKAFYAKYPTEQAFFKAHPEAKGKIKKAKIGAYVGGDTLSNPGMVDFSKINNANDMMITGMTDAMRMEQAERAASSSQKSSSGSSGMDIGGMMKMFGGEGGGGDMGGMMSALGGAAKYGKRIPIAQAGTDLMANYFNQQQVPNINNSIQSQTQSPGVNAGMFNGPQVDNSVSTINASQLANNQSGYASPGGPNTKESDATKTIKGLDAMGGPMVGIAEGLDALEAEKEQKRSAIQQRQLSELTLKASTTRPEQRERKYVRPEDMVNTGEAFFPVYGVGTNVLARNGEAIRRAQNGVSESPETTSSSTNWYEEGMDKDTYYGFKNQLESEGYKSVSKSNNNDRLNINEDSRPGGMMGRKPTIPEVDAKSPVQEKSSSFDSKSARDNWVQKTGLPWSEAKRLGYTDGSAKDNTKLLSELNDPRFKKENIRTTPPKKSSQTRTPVQHRETPTGKLTPIKKAMTLDDFYKSKGWDTSKKYKGPEIKQDKRSSYQKESDAKRSRAEYDDDLDLELPLYYMANPGKLFGDIKSKLNPFTPESETSEPYRKQVMANRYNQSISDKERSARHRQMGYELVPEAAVNTAAVLAATPYTTFEAMPLGIGQGAAPRAAGYVGQGAARLNQAAPKMLSQPYTPNFVMYQDGGMVGGNPTEIQNTYGDGNSIYDDLGYTPLIDENQQKSFRQGGYIPQAQDGFQNWQNSMSGGGSGFSGAGASGGTPWGAIGSQATATGQSAMGGQNAGGKIGGTVGKSVGSIFGPVGGAIGEFAGGMIGNVLDKNPKTIKKEQEKTQRNIQNMAMNQMAPSIQAGYASHVRNGGDIPNYENGGYMNPEYNPQVITMFGDVDEQDFADFAHKDEFRAGGHLKAYREPSERAMQTYENGGGVKSYGLGGELQTHWGGGAETMSYNPYLPGSGETVMFRGKSHEEYSPNGETGIGVTYGGNPVEVERGEPMVELQEGGTIDPQTGEPQKSGVVFGNLKIPDQYIDLLGDKNAKGKKFKNYIADLSKTEEKQNKMIEKSTNELNALDVNSSFDRLKLSSLQANIKGGNLKLKEIADKKIKAADLQNAINETAEEYGVVADDLARGKVKQDKNAMKEYAKFGGKFTKAQDGKKAQFNSEKEALAAGYIKDANGFYRIIPPEKLEPIETKVAEAMREVPLQHKDASGLYGGASAKLAQTQRNNPWFDWAGFNPTVKADVERFQKAFNERARSIGSSASLEVDGKFGDQTASAIVDEKRMTQPSVGRREEAEILEADTKPVPYKRSGLIDFGNQLLDYIRPTDQEPFDYGQTMGEQYALATNQLEPVQAQLYKPEIGVPYDISYQDVLNENQADFNAQTRKTGYNPAAQSNLNAQKYMANQRVLGEQFRANQAMKDQVYTANRNTLNQAKLTNLGILDKQYERQSEAMSNTKATTQAALNSISDKLAKHKLENRTLGVYENLYKYRFDDKGRAINMNGIFQPNIPTVASKEGTQRQVPVYKKDGTIDHYQLEEYDPNDTTDTTKPGSTATPGIVAKNGKSITKKNNKNSSIVKAIKNL